MNKTITSKIHFLFFAAMLCILNNSAFALGTGGADIGTASIEIPGNICAGPLEIVTVIQNYGSTVINSATINWSVNSNTQTPYQWTGTLNPGDLDTVDLGSYNIPPATYNSIAVYTSNPNGAGDADASNDYASQLALSNLSGIYTIGGVNPDFTTFQDAVNALISYGVCAPVTFSMRPLVETVQVSIPEIFGASSTNTITFQSENTDSSSVVLTYPTDTSSGSTNYLLKLDGADFLQFNQITLERSGVDDYGRVIEFTGEATHNSFSNCHLIGSSSSTTLPDAALVFSDAAISYNDSLNTFSGNLFEKGSIGISMNGLDTIDPSENNLISGNYFLNQSSRAIEMTNQSSLLVTHNKFVSTSLYSLYEGIHLTNCSQNQLITYNLIQNVPGTGIQMDNCYGISGVPSIIANNLIQAEETAISIVNCHALDVLNNSMNISGIGNMSADVYMTGASTSINLINNVLTNTGGGYTYIISDSAAYGISSSNYNDLYTTGTLLASFQGIDANDLAAWQTLSQHDTNSVSLDPVFVAPNDLHATSIPMDNLGVNISIISDDYDGDGRSLTTPDIGADEYTGILHNITLSVISLPGDTICADTLGTVQIVITNPGGFPESGFNYSIDISGPTSFQFTQPYFNTLSPGTSDTLTYPGIIHFVSGTYTITATVSSIFDTNPTDDSVTITTFVYPTFAAPTAANQFHCGTGDVLISATPSTTDSVYWYDAPTGGNLLYIGSNLLLSNLATDTTFYVQTGNYCPDQPRITVSGIIHSLPSIFLGNDTSIFPGDQLILDAGIGFASYSWNTGNSTQTLDVSALAPDTFSVTVVDTNGCQASDTISVDLSEAISNINNYETFTIYPNPATTSINIESSSSMNSSSSIQIAELTGKIIIQEILPAGINKKSINIDNLPKGIYLIRINNASEHNTYQLIKQ